jgi:hypothetical protein
MRRLAFRLAYPLGCAHIPFVAQDASVHGIFIVTALNRSS